MNIIKLANQARNLSTQVMGRWTVLYPECRKKGAVYYRCVCKCGNTGLVRGSSLGTYSQSCGCYQKEAVQAQPRKRNGNAARVRGTLAYFKCSTWGNMLRRTVNNKPNPKNKSYILKGIRLEMTRLEFYTWCDSQWPIIQKLYEQDKTPSIDRIDSNGHYCLTNIQIL